VHPWNLHNVNTVVNGLNRERVLFGELCLFTDPCAVEPCENGGICSATSDGGYLCDCPCPYEGNDCEINEISKYQLNLSSN
jgi:hypothetical protein